MPVSPFGSRSRPQQGRRRTGGYQRRIDNGLLMPNAGAMPIPHPDHERAALESGARRRLQAAGAASLPRPPWLHDSQPPSSVDLVRFAVWRAETDRVADDDIEAALALLPAARAEMEQLEAAMLVTARAKGLSWGRISRPMGLGSAQAASQRFDRLAGRGHCAPES